MYFPLLCRSTYSLLSAYPKTDEFAPRLRALGLPGCALVEMGNLGGTPSFLDSMAAAGLRGLAGCEFCVPREGAAGADGANPGGNPDYDTVWVLCRNQAGWQSLVRAVSLSHDAAHNVKFRKKDVPRITLEELAGFAADWLVFAGAPGSVLTSGMFTDPSAYSSASPEEARSLVAPGWADRCLKKLEYLKRLFGAALRLDVQCGQGGQLPALGLVADGVRYLSRKSGVPAVAAVDCRYLAREDAADCVMLKCIDYNKGTAEVRREVEKSGAWRDSLLFLTKGFYLRSPEEMRELYSDGELRAALDAAALCEPPAIKGAIRVPKFDCPGGASAEDHFTQLCRDGWAKRVEPALKKVPPSLRPARRREYAERIKMELGVLREAGFCSYFLVIHDVIRHVREDLKKKVGPGRGSVGGSLAAYLSGITRVDPLEYGLLFERFINKGRLQPGKNTPPDIDVDFQIDCRDDIIAYLRGKYGEACVSQMGTFMKIKGRSALRAVLTHNARCSFADMNAITDPVPDESAIADDLEEMRKEEEVPSIVLWSLLNRPEALREWCWLDAEGELQGDLAADFAQAVRLEGRCRGMGKHASAVVVAPSPVSDIVPMIFDKSGGGHLITGYDMRDCEVAGLLKLDILGLATLDKLNMYEKLMRTGSL